MSSNKRVWPGFAGDCENFAKFLEEQKTNSIWICVKFADALLRGYGQIMISNNPLSGLLILVALTIGSPLQSLMGLFTGSIGLLWSAVIGQSSHLIIAGETTFNPILFGNFVVKALPDIFELACFGHWVAIVFGSILCVYATSALSGLFSKWNVPCFTLPFILVEYLLVLSVVHPNGIASMSLRPGADRPAVVPVLLTASNYTNNTETPPSTRLQDSIELPSHIATLAMNATSFEATSDRKHINAEGIPIGDHFYSDDIHHVKKTPEKLNWGKIFSGIVTSASHVLGVESVPMASIIYLAMLIYSPTMAGFAFLGAFIGTVTGIPYSNGVYDNVYSGIWGYNGFLTGAATVELGFIVTLQTTTATVIAIIFATMLQHVLNIVFEGSVLLMYNLPFVFACIMFFCLSITSEDSFPKPSKFSYPEKQRSEYKIYMKMKKNTIADPEGDALMESSKRVTLTAVKELT